MHVLPATYILAGAAKSLKRTVGTASVGNYVGMDSCEPLWVSTTACTSEVTPAAVTDPAQRPINPAT
jgi:hypothetical protein